MSKYGMSRKVITARKIWRDVNNLYDTRPEFVEIILFRNGEVYKNASLNESNDWTHDSECLPICKQY